jgi:hypothetical protein
MMQTKQRKSEYKNVLPSVQVERILTVSAGDWYRVIGRLVLFGRGGLVTHTEIKNTGIKILQSVDVLMHDSEFSMNSSVFSLVCLYLSGMNQDLDGWCVSYLLELVEPPHPFVSTGDAREGGGGSENH